MPRSKLISIFTASEQPSDAEIKQGEEEAAVNVRRFAVGSLVLYFSMSQRPLMKATLLTMFCTLAPHLIAYFKKLL